MKRDFYSHGNPTVLTHCPYCASTYQDTDGSYVDSLMEQDILHVHCSVCRRALLVFVRQHADGLMCMGILTDCSSDDASRFWRGRKISIDDVLFVHQALRLDNYTKIS